MKKRYFPFSQSPLFLALLCILFAKVENGYSQSPDDKNWSSSFGQPGVTGIMDVGGPGLLYYKDTLYFGTTLREFGQQKLSGVYKWDGKNFLPFRGKVSPKFGTKDTTIYAIVLDSSGRIIIGGRFDSVDGRPAKNIAYWDGNEWEQLGGGLPKNLAVVRLACSKSGIYALCSDNGLNGSLLYEIAYKQHVMH